MSGEALTARAVAACVRRPWAVVALAAALCAAASYYVVANFAMDTDAVKLVSEDLPWRKREQVFDAAFPHRTELIAVVIDAATPEQAEYAAATLAARLANDRARFRHVWRPDGGPFFDRAGLLFDSKEGVAQTTQALIVAQPLLGALAADPNLRGLADALARVAQGVSAEPQKAGELALPLSRLADAFDGIVAGRPAPFSWRALIVPQGPDPRELRRFVLVQPVLDYTALQPGAAATAAIRAAARDTDVRIRLTGPVPLADEEFATLAEGAALDAFAMMTALVALLWAAVRSWRLLVAVLANLGAGLIATAAFGVAAFGPFNLISVAFAVLFVGLGIDFGIQFCMAYRARRHAGEELRAAVRSAAGDVGGALALAAAAIAAGFFAFAPTEYRGVAQLGVVAGAGMIVAFVTTVTLLPALIVVMRPPREDAPIGYARLARLDRVVSRRRRWVLAAACIAAAASVAVLPRLSFDFNPLHLKSPRAESVATLLDLARDPNTTPSSIDVLAASEAEAAALARRLSQLPEVDHATTLASFVPEQQDEKLALIEDAALLLDPVLNPERSPGPLSDRDTAAALERAAKAMRGLASAQPATATSAAAARLGASLEALANGDAALRDRAAAVMMPGLATTLAQLRAAMQARRITLSDVPQDVKGDWVAADGRARIEVFPKGDSNDNETLRRFVTAVRRVVPGATGAPVSIQESGSTISRAFVEAGAWALVAIVVLLAVVLRSMRDVLLTLAPLALSGLVTLGLCAALGVALNFENVIALPLLAGIGVAFNIYFVMASRGGVRDLLQSSLARAVIYSALTTGTAFGSLWLSSHPGTASMGMLLSLSLACTLACTLIFLPALLCAARPTARPRDRG
ncbi:MAG TPA: MMPL family transporter [Casimicrobiaceae bacterium]|nr:MMPL family transporter [Casimicrobiaceae bacterium]